MKQRTRRELEFSVKLISVSPRTRQETNSALQRLRDNPPDIIITRNLAHRADEFMAATGRRLFVRQVATGIYRRLADDRGPATPLGIAVAALLTIAASYGIVGMALAFSSGPNPTIASENALIFGSAAAAFLLTYAVIWLRIGVQTINRARTQMALR